MEDPQGTKEVVPYELVPKSTWAYSPAKLDGHTDKIGWGVALNCAEGHHTHNSGNGSEVFASFILQKIMVDYYFS